ncbi:yip1 interacting factor [Anaeramoeba ignava]|uniref:Protein YIF1 n=1 Tax=Anaeramoeba ignava TaxID=1746090 RepID=A0A9Q0RFM3_ANAIG|nr:yip1 interacting factor [Anaeramoeba ignava]
MTTDQFQDTKFEIKHTRSQSFHFEDNGGFDDQLAKFGLSYGARLVSKGNQVFQNNFSKNFSFLKFYFNVNNSYILNKLKIILFPFRHENWQRIQDGNINLNLPPRADINAPDLYIPLMSYITYILLASFASGIKNSWNPEIMGLYASIPIVIIGLEILILNLIFFLVNQISFSWFFSISSCGYKFVGIDLSIIIGLLFGNVFRYITLFITSFSMAVFLMRQFKAYATNLENSLIVKNALQNRIYLIFLIELPIAWFFSNQKN